MSITAFLERNQHYGPVLVRIGVSLVFLWFGIDKFFHVQTWIGWIPPWMAQLIPFSLVTFMYIQGIIESVVGAMLLLGYRVRFAGFIAALTLLGAELAMVGTGQTELMLRDAALLAASASLCLTGSFWMSLDRRSSPH